MVKVSTNIIALLLVLVLSVPAYSQELPANAIENVMIHKADGSVINSGAIVWRNGVIEAVGAESEIPFDAHVLDGGDSLHVYPGFINGMTTWGSPDRGELKESDDSGYERAGIQPERSPGDVLKTDDENLKNALKHGFTIALIGLEGEMLPGRTDIFFLHGKNTDSGLFKENTGILFQFEGSRGGFRNRAYPNTTMGVMAQFRQLMYNAEALKQHIEYFDSADDAMPAPERDEVLESLFPLLDNEIPVYFVADSPEDLERFLILQDEFGFSTVLVSGKNIWRKAEELKNRNIPVLVSVELPDMPEWYKEEKNMKESETDTVSQKKAGEKLTQEEEKFRERQLKAYMQAVQNINSLKKAGVTVGFAGIGLTSDEFDENFKILMDEGELTKNDLIRLTTIDTAGILNISNKTGEIRPGNIASFSVMTEPFGEEKSKVIKTVSNGQIHEF